ncbi:MAG: sulfatase-like hydrolase/transferase [Planctomycetota bacterium]
MKIPLWGSLLLASALLACTKSEPSALDQEGAQASNVLTSGLLAAGDTRDLIVVAVDTLRADRLPFYGAERATGGDVEQKWSMAWLAAHGTLWENAWSPAGMTLPSFTTFWTGMAPLEHGSIGNFTATAEPTFAMELASRGWKGHSVVANRVLSKGCGVQRGFATSLVRSKQSEPSAPRELLVTTKNDISQGQRVFIWAHYMAPHQPYEPSAKHLGTFSSREGVQADKATLMDLHRFPEKVNAEVVANVQALYDEEILTANDYVMEVLRGLERQYQDAGRGALLDNAVVVFMSDHGEELLDRNGYSMHAKSIFSGTTHVPLMVLGKEWMAGKRVREGIALADVLPMVLRGKESSREYFFSAYRQTYYMVRDARWSLVHNPTANLHGPPEPPKDATYHYPVVALYDRAVDPKELHDVSAKNPEVTRRMLDALRAWHQGLNIAGEEQEQVSPEEMAALEELGYASASDHEGESSRTPWPGSQWNP